MCQIMPDRICQNIQIRQPVSQGSLMGIGHVRLVHYIRVRLVRQFRRQGACSVPGQVSAGHVEDFHGCGSCLDIPFGEEVHDIFHAGIGTGDMREECVGLIQHESLCPFEDQGVEGVQDIGVCHAESAEHTVRVREEGIRKAVTGQKSVEGGGNREDT